MRRIEAVELLRGVAAIAVMGFHFSISHPITGFSELFASGHIGVELFFLVSGFVIYVSTEEDRDCVAFTVRRLFRIVPLAWACVAAAHFVMPPAEHPNLIADLFFFPADTISVPPGPPVYHFHILPPLWTLAYEMWFYANFAFALWLAPARRGTWAACQVVIAMLAFQWIGATHLTLDAQSMDLSGAAFIANPMVLFFPIGMLLGWTWLSFRIEGLPMRLTAGFVLCFLAAMAMTPPVSYGLYRRGIVAIPIFILVVWVIEKLPRPVARFGIWAGSLSYAIYLIHLMTEFAIGTFAPQPIVNLYVAAPQYVQVAVLIALTVMAATLAHVLIEKPAQRIGKIILTLLEGKAKVPARLL